MTRVLITGASGLLGVNLALQASHLGYDVLGWVNDTTLPNAPFQVARVNLLEKEHIAQQISAYTPELIIHCAALANIEAAEADPELAEQLNCEVPGIIATTAAKHGIRLIHISTDAVFDGQRSGYTEGDTPNPMSVYARTKLDGEFAVRSANPQALIVRVNFYGWSLSGTRSLAEFFFNNLSKGNSIKGFMDVFYRPLYTRQLGSLLLEMSRSDLQGIYHVLSHEINNKYDFGVAVAEKFGYDSSLISPVSVADAGFKAVRSPKLDLSVAKIEHDLGHNMPDQLECLDAFYQDYQSGLPGKIRNFK